MEWTWDERKAATNWRAHRVLFETATLVFDVDHRLIIPDPHPDADRWRTIGMVYEDGSGRIISARLASRSERRHYETIFLKGYYA